MIDSLIVGPFISYLKKAGVKLSTLTDYTGIAVSDIVRPVGLLPFEQVAALFDRAAVVCSDELLGLRAGLQGAIERRTLLHYLCKSAPTVGDAMRLRAKYAAVVSTANEKSYLEKATYSRMEWDFLTGNIPRVQISDYLVGLHVRRVQDLLQRKTFPKLVELDHAPRSDRRNYEALLRCQVKFDCRALAVLYQGQVSRTNLSTTDPNLLLILEPIAAATVRDRPSRSNVVARVKRAIMNQMANSNIELTAAQLQMTPRTLQRRLAAADTTFSRIYEEAKKEMASELVRSSSMSITEISYSLGYSEPSAFSRQYKLWYDISPRLDRMTAHAK